MNSWIAFLRKIVPVSLSILLSHSQGKGTLFKIFKIQEDEFILPLVADRFLSIGWVPMSFYSSLPESFLPFILSENNYSEIYNYAT